MTLRYTALASGSGGNANLIQSDGYAILIDGGLPAKELTQRLRLAGHSTTCFQGMLLTHVHSDHWNDGILGLLVRRSLPLYCHPSHHPVLSRYSRNFAKLYLAGLVRDFFPGQELTLSPSLRCIPVPVRHDGGETFGFRLSGPGDLFGSATEIGFASDLGTWDERIVEAFTDVDLLAIEFNHDVDLERRSTRPAHLISRVLSDDGHLSNDQAARLVQAILARSTPGRLQHVVQLHLSEDCNRPVLARDAAKVVLASHEFEVGIQTASQNRPGKILRVEHGCAKRRQQRIEGALLPGLE